LTSSSALVHAVPAQCVPSFEGSFSREAHSLTGNVLHSARACEQSGVIQPALQTHVHEPLMPLATPWLLQSVASHAGGASKLYKLKLE
jgi:hypothetical protein